MSRVDEALCFAIDAHAGMVRKVDGLPYILHPMEVATIVASITGDEDVICAALLHDVVEDTPHTLDEIREAFGDRVADLVDSETEDKREGLPPSETWRLRKEESLGCLRGARDEGVRILWLADKLANLRSFARLKRDRGDALWDSFNQKDPRQHAWYYTEVAKGTASLSQTFAWQELDRLVHDVFADVR